MANGEGDDVTNDPKTPTSSRITAALSDASSPAPRHPAFSLKYIKNHVYEILDFSNYLIWRELFIPVLKAHQVFGFVDGTTPCPPLGDPDYAQWVQIDCLILSWIQATLSREILRNIIPPG
ncbi:OLC1v1030567C1 [Oldenlandia corymbosa var. corymbosa]|uniref:OLC1v1030567C1 n=1 Tax=Oldenlandia corymbosa var. corymbosa TaxID=529605 RepID=A0AAV1CI13_OLDCO|nr:OLC1v1030567C1 [Oldenlandia corymbosa var. corymbosa]